MEVKYHFRSNTPKGFYILLLLLMIASCTHNYQKGVENPLGKYDILNNNYISSWEFQRLYTEDTLIQEYINSKCKQECKLILLFSETACPVCIQIEIDNLSKILDSSQVILCCAAESSRYFSILKRENRFSFPIYRIEKSTSSICKYLSTRPIYLFTIKKICLSFFYRTKTTMSKQLDILKPSRAFSPKKRNIDKLLLFK